MHTEQDTDIDKTFDRLRGVSFFELINLLDLWASDVNDRRKFSEVLSDNHWTLERYHTALNNG